MTKADIIKMLEPLRDIDEVALERQNSKPIDQFSLAYAYDDRFSGSHSSTLYVFSTSKSARVVCPAHIGSDAKH